MSTLSYPYVEQDMTSDLWRKVMANGDGIIDDYTGNAFALTVSTDTATVAAGFYRLNGQVMENPTPLGFSMPAVVVATVYQIGVRFDPSKDSDLLGPLSLVSGVKGAVSVPAGGSFYVLYEVTRNPGQAMSAGVTPVGDLRRWKGDSIVVKGGGRPALPRGSFLWDSAGAQMFVRDLPGPGSLIWVSASPPGPVRGVSSVTFINGVANITHNAGFTPSVFLVQAQVGATPVNVSPSTAAFSFNRVSCYAYRVSNGTLYSGTISKVQWVAYP